MTPSEILDDQIEKSKLHPGLHKLLKNYKLLRSELAFLARPLEGADGNHQADINRASAALDSSDQLLISLVNEK